MIYLRHVMLLLICSALAVAAAGCGSSRLEVKVSVLSPEYLDQHRSGSPIENLEKQAEAAEAALNPGGVLSVDSINSLDEAFREMLVEYENALVENGLFPSDAEPLAPSIADDLRGALFSARGQLIVGKDAIRQAQDRNSGELEQAFADYKVADDAFTQADTILRQTIEGARTDLGNYVGDDHVGAEQPISEADRLALEARFTGIVSVLNNAFGSIRATVVDIKEASQLRGDPLLGYVLLADDHHWRGIFNRAFAYTHGTNTDIAIVMDDIDKFSIKGLRVDASAATKATFIALGRVMDIAAAVSGVPIGGLLPDPPTTPASTGGLESGTQRQAQMLTISRASVDASILRSRLELLRLMDAVLNESDADLQGEGELEESVRTRIADRLTPAAKTP